MLSENSPSQFAALWSYIHLIHRVWMCANRKQHTHCRRESVVIGWARLFSTVYLFPALSQALLLVQ